MFGPDICGSATRKVHVIFNYKGKNHLIKKEIPCETDQLTHVYTLIVHPDQTYEVRIDGKTKQSGNLIDDWDFLPPRKIKDPNVSKVRSCCPVWLARFPCLISVSCVALRSRLTGLTTR